MLIWTGLFVLNLLLNVGAAVLSIGAAAAAGAGGLPDAGF